MAGSYLRPSGPPLNSLRAFEAAARLGGFAKAADELGVTAGAISQHIRSLEQWSDQPLFERRAQGVQLTPQGRQLLPSFTNAFDQLGAAVRDLRNLSPNPTITITALPSIAQLWLQPRLPQFRAALGGVSISINIAETPPNLSRDLVDLSLFFRPEDDVASGVVLAKDRLTPKCAPDYPLTTVNDLTKATLLHDDIWAEDWLTWSQATNTYIKDANAGPRFSLYAMAIQEAKAGAGVVIGHTALMGKYLAEGSLVQPFEDQSLTGLPLVADIADGPQTEVVRRLMKELAQ